ncbi:MAG: malate--CoA ligase subunit beta [Pseudonocardiaceae bacterium]|nr:malate--CoA ligase subunit beta [Pseudonocardiaceae bacterium]
MDIHEYQAKEILARFGVPMPRGGLVYSPEQAAYRATEIGGAAWVAKAQVHSGGRGEAGGVKLCRSDREIADVANILFGHRLVTRQSGPAGKPVFRVYVEEATDIARELYFGIVLDRRTEQVMVIASAEGGMEIEELADSNPDTLLRTPIEPALGFLEFQAREIAFALRLEPKQIAQASRVFHGAYRAFRDLDATMLEINPLVVTRDGGLVALDAKMSFDDNALFRHPDISELRDHSQEDARESDAADRGLSYVGLDGDIGCMINGAGLAMATMDMIKLAGGEPANFLDIGGGASPERVLKAFRAVLQDSNVKVMLVNIFAGINRCDWVAEGIVSAFKEIDVKLPVVVRLAGTHVELGKQILRESGLPIVTADTLAEAAEKAVEATVALARPIDERPANGTPVRDHPIS